MSIRKARGHMLPLVAGFGLLLHCNAPTAFGQGTVTPKDEPSKVDPVRMDELTVTGSNIPTSETAFTAGPLPLVRIDQKVIEQSGLGSVSELLQRITVSNNGSVPISNNATGFTPAATSISLRGLGPEATLVLINGRRVAPYPVGTGGTTAFVDLNSIPISAVDSIEILKDGASAVYGADAVAGVVNIKMRRGIDGTEAYVNYGNTTNADSTEINASVITGAQTEKANVLIGFNFYSKQAIMNRDREYSAVPPFLSSNSSPLNLEVTRAAINGALGVSDPNALFTATGIAKTTNFLRNDEVYTAAAVDRLGLTGSSAFGYTATAPASADLIRPLSGLPVIVDPADSNNRVRRDILFVDTFAVRDTNTGALPASSYTIGRTRGSAFNFNEFSMSYPERRNKGMFAFGERKLLGTENVKGYLDLSYQNSKTENQLAPSATGNFSGSGIELVIPARTASPLPLPDGRARAAVAGAFNRFNPFNIDITGGTRARLAEFGNRIYRNETDATLISAGVKGTEIAGKWNFDLSYSYSEIQDTSRNTLVSSSRFNRLMNEADPIFSPSSPEYIGTTIPYNPFGYYKNSIANNEKVVEYAKITVKDLNTSKISAGNFVLSNAELLTLEAGPVGFAIGGDVRYERLNQYPDPYGATGDLIGSSPNASTNAQRKIGGIFTEVRIPVLSHVPGAHSLVLEGAVRHEKFYTSHRKTTVPKVAVGWKPIDDTLLIRGSWSKGFREPSLYELYSSPTAALFPITHPLTGAFEPEQDVTVAGNRRLEAEKTKYLNLGTVWSPTWKPLQGLSLAVDYWKIDRRGTVDNDYQDTVDRFFGTKAGGLLPGESVVLFSSGAIRTVNSVFFNVGQTKADGVDLSASYTIRTENFGRFELSTSWAKLNSFEKSSSATEPLVDLVGTDSTGTGDDGYLEWKGRVQLEWSYKNLTFFVGTNFTDGFQDFDPDGVEFMIDRTWIWDAQLSYNFRNTFAPWLSDTKIAIGGRNIFDKTPPFSSGFGGSSTGYPGFLYNSEGQFFYVSLNRKL